MYILIDNVDCVIRWLCSMPDQSSCSTHQCYSWYLPSCERLQEKACFSTEVSKNEISFALPVNTLDFLGFLMRQSTCFLLRVTQMLQNGCPISRLSSKAHKKVHIIQVRHTPQSGQCLLIRANVTCNISDKNSVYHN